MEVRLALNRIGRQFGLAGAIALLCVGVQGQVVKAPRYTGGLTAPEAPVRQLVLPALPPAITKGGTVVEDVVVRVNDQIISRSDVERSEEQLEQEAAQQQVPASELAAKQKDMLRDMIDQQLLLSKAKELGLNADADVIRQLDEIRKQNNMASMDELEKAVRSQGVSFEDFKAKTRNQILTQQVVRDEVGKTLRMSQGEEAKYYEEHKAEFQQPEQIRLSEILVPLPETATPAEIVQAQKKADGLKTELMQGTDFATLAKKSSGGPTAAQGGELGLFKRGALAKVLEDQTFDLKIGESTQPIRTRQGFVILKVTRHDQAGAAPLKDVEPQVQEAVYMNAMQPALRAYLTKLREQSYVDIQPGFVDSGASAKETKPVFTAYAPPAVKKKKVKTTVRFDRTGRAVLVPVKDKAVVSSPDATGSRTLTGAEAQTENVDPATGLAKLDAPPKPMAPVKMAKNGKPAKIHREKVRFGQAPRSSIAASSADEVAVGETTRPAVLQGTSQQAAADLPANGALGAVSATPAGTESANLSDNALNPVTPPRAKTRFSANAEGVKANKVKKVTAKQTEKTLAAPVAASTEEKEAQQTNAAPLGLNGDTSKKPAKPKKVKGAKKERLEEKKKVAPVVAEPVAPTANPALAPTESTPASTRPGVPGTGAPVSPGSPAPPAAGGTPQ